MIDQQTVNRILDTARIEEVVGEFVTLRRRGANYTGLCPFHDDRTPSFSVSPSKGICKCFACGKGGNVVHFLMEHEHLSYYEALKWLARRYNIEVHEKELTPEEKQKHDERESMFIINEMARDHFCDCMLKTQEGQSVGLAYFRQRGIRDDIIARFQLGYCSERRDGFSQAALQKGYDRRLLVKTGLSVDDGQGRLFDRYRGRVIFPVHTVSGKVVAFGGRILKKAEKLAKYVNSPESEIYHKSDELYGLYQAKQTISKLDRCYLVEGYVDVLSMHQSGICNVVASSGTSLTHGQIRLIHRFTDNVTVLYDGDAAGIKASLRSINMLLEEGLNIKVVLLPDGEDPDSYAQSHSATEFMDYIKTNETDFIRFKAGILLKDSQDDPLSRAGAIRELVESIAVIPDEIVRSEYVKECSRQLGAREEMLLKEVGKTRMRLAEQRRQQRAADARRAALAASPDGSASASPVGSSDASREAARPDAGAADAVAADRQADASAGNADDLKAYEDLLGPAAPLSAPSALTPGRQPSTVLAGPSGKPSANPYEPFEANLIRIVVRYGERPLGEGTDVISYVADDLNADGISLTVPLYRKMLEEAVAHRRDEGFRAQRFFVMHPDPEISLQAADMISDRYTLSKLYQPEENQTNNVKVFQRKIETEEESLPTLVPRLLEDLKYRVLKAEIADVRERIKQAQRSGQADAVSSLLAEYQQLHEIEREFSKHLGERIIG